MLCPVFRCPESCSGLIVSLLHSLRGDRIYVWWWLQSDIVVVTVGHDNSVVNRLSFRSGVNGGEPLTGVCARRLNIS